MPLPDTVLASMRDTNNLFCSSVESRDLASLDTIYTADASILPPGSDLIQGLEAIRRFWHETIHGLDIKSATLTTVSVEGTGDAAVEIGRVELTLATGAIVPAKYVVYWKAEDGGWKWHVDIWNMNV